MFPGADWERINNVSGTVSFTDISNIEGGDKKWWNIGKEFILWPTQQRLNEFKLAQNYEYLRQRHSLGNLTFFVVKYYEKTQDRHNNYGSMGAWKCTIPPSFRKLRLTDDEQTNQQADEPTNQPADGHEGSWESDAAKKTSPLSSSSLPTKKNIYTDNAVGLTDQFEN